MIKKKRIYAIIFAFFLIHILWFLIAVLWKKQIFPTPIVVYGNIPKLVEKGLHLHFAYSLFRVFLGLFCSVLLGCALGYLMGLSKRFNRILDPMFYLLYPIPKLALLPIIILLFGLGEAVKIALIILIVMPQIALCVRDGVREIPDEYYLLLRGIKASRFQKFIHVTVPATIKTIISIIRLMLGTVLSILFFAENYGTSYGLGYLIMDAWMRMDYLTMYGGILLLSITGCVLFILIDILESKCVRWE